tara:strand:+ start:317 stop:1144 length:828 start_codon:yes stop_codon:yes gene_type:complete
MVAIPPSIEKQIIKNIYESYEKNETFYFTRMGASSIGTECLRKIYFQWRRFAKKPMSGRILRLFETGYIQEERVLNDLIKSGLDVWQVNEYGSPFEFTDSTGHFVCRADGVVTNIPRHPHSHLLEIKTHSKKSFSALQRHGVQKSKPEHYAQVQISMALGSFQRALYVAVCKDDEQFYIERFKPDKREQKELQKRITSLINARMRPTGISVDGSSFQCKYCDMRSVCIKDDDPLVHCRTCENSIPSDNGTWECTLHGEKLTLEAQEKTCKDYSPL